MACSHRRALISIRGSDTRGRSVRAGTSSAGPTRRSRGVVARFRAGPHQRHRVADVACPFSRAAFEHYVRVTAAERRRAERLMGGGSLGRSFSRSYAGSLSGSLASSLAGASAASAALPQPGAQCSGTLPHGSALAAAREVAAASLDSPIVRAAGNASSGPGLKRASTVQAAPPGDADNLDAKDRRRASLRVRRRLHSLLSWA